MQHVGAVAAELGERERDFEQDGLALGPESALAGAKRASKRATLLLPQNPTIDGHKVD